MQWYESNRNAVGMMVKLCMLRFCTRCRSLHEIGKRGFRKDLGIAVV